MYSRTNVTQSKSLTSPLENAGVSNRIAGVLFAALLLLSFDTASTQTSASSIGIQTEQPASTSAKAGQIAVTDEGKKNRDFDGPEWMLVYVTVGLAVITLSLAIVTGFLWRSTKELVDRGDTTARTHERAYLFCGLQPTGNPSAVMSCRNEGRTLGRTTAIQWGLWPEENFPMTMSVSEIIDSEAPWPLPIQRATYEEVIRVESRDTLIWPVRIECDGNVEKVLFGRLWYEDVFKTAHYSTFKFRPAVLEQTSVKPDPLEGCYTDWS
jgi:hypothetical protein